MKPNRTRLRMQMTVRHVRSIRLGLRALYSVDQILDAWYQQHHPEAESQMTLTTAQARDWVRLNAHRLDTERLNSALGRVYADGWVLGEDITAYEIARAVGIRKAAPSKKQLQNALQMDWSKWKAGNRAAARLVAPPDGLRRLMARRGVKIDEMSRTTLNRIGTRLAEGLQQGFSRRQMAQSIDAVLNDAARALTIAGTEMSAAVVQASKDLYAESGVEMIEWLVADPCDDCQANLDASPIAIGEEWPEGDPPVHPNCMCDIAPYVVDTGLWGWLNEEE